MNIEIEKIIRKNRKTISLQLTDEAKLIVIVPLNLNDEMIKKIVWKKRNWIREKMKEIKKRKLKFPHKEFISGEGFMYLGKYYKLNIVDDLEEPLVFKNGFFLSKSKQLQAKELFVKWYKKVAYEKILERVQKYAQKRGFKYNKIKITDAKKRWGSCSPNGNLNFSWRLVMAPLRVIDYVVVHELVHLEEKNHKKAFWNKVKVLLPDYENYKNWLKENSYLLNL